jgi:prefoldin subunit 5
VEFYLKNTSGGAYRFLTSKRKQYEADITRLTNELEAKNEELDKILGKLEELELIQSE